MATGIASRWGSCLSEKITIAIGGRGPRPSSEPAQPEGRIAIDHEGILTGWAYDPNQLNKKLVVEVLADGEPIAAVRADCYSSELRSRGVGDGCFGFVIDLETVDAELFELTLANDNRLLASVRRSATSRDALAHRISPGEVLWRGGLRLSGWLAAIGVTPGEHPAPEFYLGEQRLTPSLRLNPGPSDLPVAAGQFDCLLPSSLADGNIHQIRVIGPGGSELTGSPVTIFATPGSYSEWIRSTVDPGEWNELRSYQAERLDRLIPQSVPFEAYPQWKQVYGLKTEEALKTQTRHHRIGVLVFGEIARETTLASIEAQAGDLHISVAALGPLENQPGVYDASSVKAGVQALRSAGVSGIVIIRSGTVLLPAACLTLAEALVADGEGEAATLALADHELQMPDGTVVPFFGPAFDYERLWSQGYAEGMFACAIEALDAADTGQPLSTYDLIFTAVEYARSKGRPIVHIPQVLGSVPQLDVATAENHLANAVVSHALRTHQPIEAIEKGRGRLFPNVWFKRPVPEGHVAIIIPTRDRLDLLRPCLETLKQTKDPHTYSVHIIDNGSRELETADYLAARMLEGMTVHRDDRPFNYAQMHNTVVPSIDAEFICLLNNDVEILDPDWLDEMKRHFSREDVGAVGAKLIWPNGMLQHGGVVLGTGFAASHAYDRYLASEAGYADGILVPRECGAVTAACLLMRQTTFMDLGRFDEEAFPVAFNDVDLCLRLRLSGRHVIWTPAAALLHRESASRKGDRQDPAKSSRADKELDILRERWGAEIAHDAHYNPNLSLAGFSFTGLAAPPRRRSARLSEPKATT